MLSYIKQITNDYDWFCVINDKPVCVASAGCVLPKSINIGNRVLDMMKKIEKIEAKFDFEINIEYLRNNVVNKGYEYLNNNGVYKELWMPRVESLSQYELPIQFYCEYFVNIAKKGFYVFDKTMHKPDLYHLVAWPKNCCDCDLKKFFFDKKSVDIHIQSMNFASPTSLVNLKLVEMVDDVVFARL